MLKSPPDQKVDSGAAERIDELISDLSDLFLDLWMKKVLVLSW